MNRTKMVVKASFVSLFMYVLTAILAIIRTGIFIKGYGSASNGAMQLSNQIFNYLFSAKIKSEFVSNFIR